MIEPACGCGRVARQCRLHEEEGLSRGGSARHPQLQPLPTLMRGPDDAPGNGVAAPPRVAIADWRRQAATAPSPRRSARPDLWPDTPGASACGDVARTVAPAVIRPTTLAGRRRRQRASESREHGDARFDPRRALDSCRARRDGCPRRGRFGSSECRGSLNEGPFAGRRSRSGRDRRPRKPGDILAGRLVPGPD